MSTTDVTTQTDSTSKPDDVDLKLEVVVIPVSDVDRSKAFYERLGWRLDADFSFDNGFRVVQFTPPGSGASMQFGTKITTAAPGTAQGLYLVVSDIEAARAELAARGADVTEVFHPSAPGGQFEPGCTRRPRRRHGRATRELRVVRNPSRPRQATRGCSKRSRRGCPAASTRTTTTYASIADLADAMRRASVAHGEHEARIGEADPNWPDWYAAYMVAEQAGTPLPE